MQHEFRGATLNDALKKVAWDIETKRTKRTQRPRAKPSKARQCAALQGRIDDILSQMQRITDAIESVSEETRREIRRAERATREAQGSLFLDVVTLLGPLAVVSRSAKVLRTAVESAKRAAANAGKGTGAVLTGIDIVELVVNVNQISENLETIKNNRELVEQGRRLGRLSRALARTRRRLSRAVSLHYSAGC